MIGSPLSLVIDTSALVAVIHVEPEAGAVLSRLDLVGHAGVPASCYLEACMVLSRRISGRAKLDRLLARYAITFIPLDEPIARLAADAFVRYGRGTGHAAGLNFGDCIAYATAMHFGSPLLFKGDDFRHTDVKAAL